MSIMHAMRSNSLPATILPARPQPRQLLSIKEQCYRYLLRLNWQTTTDARWNGLDQRLTSILPPSLPQFDVISHSASLKTIYPMSSFLTIIHSPSSSPGTDGIKFKTDRGTPQGDSLSPVLFIVYLEAALRDVRNILPIRPQLDIDLHLPTDTSYADDVDFLSSRGTDFQSCLPVIGDTLKQWDLTVNSAKTEFTHIERFSDCIAEEWRLTRKLGSLLGDREDVSRRMQLATGAFQRLWGLWVRGSQVRENRRVKLYNAFITPILLYNCSTWGVPSNVIKRLEAFHRRQLRTVVGIKYPQVIKNSELYKRTNSQPLGETIVRARWRLFGHVLRLNDDVPARVMMAAYFENPSSAATWRGRPRNHSATESAPGPAAYRGVAQETQGT